MNPENAARFSQMWGAPVPSWKGMHCGAMLDAAGDGLLDLFYVIGGNFLDTMPDPARMKQALARVPFRVHQDIHLNHSMLADSAEYTVLLPAKTRYEQTGGGTQTSTERRIRYSPHVAGEAPGEARSEWEILSEIGRRALPGSARAAIDFITAGQIREEMDRVMPIYHGIGQLKAEGESFQYGGARLLEGGVCPGMPGGRALFSTLVPIPPQDSLTLATRRGAQFNSIVFRDHDAITGSLRDEVFVSSEDAGVLKLSPGETVMLVSELGTMQARVRIELVKPGTLQMFWPEANVLIDRRYDPVSGEPDYNAQVTIRKMGVATSTPPHDDRA